MKFKIVETFFTPKNLKRHYDKHVISDEDGIWKMDDMSEDEYDTLGDTLSTSNASRINDRDANIIGYVTKDGRTVKYDKANQLTVVYVDDDKRGHETISLYKQPIHKFYRKLNDKSKDMEFGNHIKN